MPGAIQLNHPDDGLSGNSEFRIPNSEFRES